MTADDFRMGDRVRHEKGFKGTVVAIRDGKVSVRYVPRTGNPWTGVYGPAWFQFYPEGLTVLARENA